MLFIVVVGFINLSVNHVRAKQKTVSLHNRFDIRNFSGSETAVCETGITDKQRGDVEHNISPFKDEDGRTKRGNIFENLREQMFF